MIIGVGTDLLEIARVRSILERPSGDRFLQRVLTEKERELATAKQGRLAEFTAGRFAAKEAVVKALGLRDRQGGVVPGCGGAAGSERKAGRPDSAGGTRAFIARSGPAADTP
ncbi:holo-ACP synthase [Paenibacillus sp. P26]|nr:holo-ACP synthase [Paenibacillus sp. P26]